MPISRAAAGGRVLGRLAVMLALAACAPAVDGPAERQRAADREDGARLAAQLAALPGAIRAEVVVRRPARDPLAPRAAPVPPPGVAILVVTDAEADRAALARAAEALARAVVPEAAPAIVVEAGAPRAALARVGPFTVEAGSAGPLKAALAGALLAIAGLSAWLARAALRQRRGSSAQ